MVETIIKFGSLGILGAFLLFGMFWGLVRGFKKSLFRGLWLVGLALITFFLTPVICKVLINANISFLHINVNGVEFTSLYDGLQALIMDNEQIKDVITNNPNLLPLITQLVIMIVSTFLFPILFWLTKIVTWPIWAIIAAIVFKRKKKVVDGKKVKVKVKKHRFYGLLVGSVAAVMVCAITLMPINGTMSLVLEVDALEYYDSQNGEGIVTAMAGEEVMNYLQMYNDSALNKVFKYTGINFVSNGMYKFLTTKKINNQKVSLTEEIPLYVTLYNDIMVVSQTDFNNIDKATMGQFLDSSENLLKNLFSSKVVRVVGDDLVKYAFKILEENESFSNYIDKISVTELKELINESIEQLKVSNVTSIQQDLLNIVYIAKSLNTNDILIPLINRELSTKEYLNIVTDSVIDEVSSYMFKMPSVNNVYPISLNKGLSYVSRVLNFDYEERDFTKDNMAATDFANILKGAFAVARTLDFNSEYYLTTASFEAVGQFLDTIKNLNMLSNGVFENIVTSLVDKGKTLIDKQELNSDIKTLINKVVDKVEEKLVDKSITLKTEFKQYGVLFDDVRNAIDDFKNTSKEKLVLKDYGKLLDKLNKTNLFKDIAPDLIEAAWDMVKPQVESSLSGFGDIALIVEQIKDNFVLVLNNQNKTNPEIQSPSNLQLSLEVEFENIQSLYDFIVNDFLSYFKGEGTGVDGLMDNMFSEESTLITDFGAELNKLNSKHNLILTNDVIQDIVAQMLGIAGDQMSGDTTVKTFLDDVVTNIKENESSVDWEEELGYFKKLASAAKDGIDLNTIGSVLDSIADSQFIGYNMINDLLVDQIDTKYNELDSTDESTDEIIAEIKQNIANINKPVYDKEISHLLSVIDIVKDADTLSLTQLGQKLDEFNTSEVVASVRPKFITYALDKVDTTSSTTVETIVNTIKTNVSGIPSVVADNFYETELTALNTIIELEYPSDKEGITNEIMSSIGDAFYVASGTVLGKNLGEVVIDIMIDMIDVDEISDILTSIKQTVTSDTGILKSNRSTGTEDANKKQKYVACFTDLYQLSTIYDDISSCELDSTNIDTSSIGQNLDKFAQLSIVTDEDKTITNIILDKINTQIEGELDNLKDQKKSQVNGSSMDSGQKETANALIDSTTADLKQQFESALNDTKSSVTNKTDEQSYVTILAELKSTIDEVVKGLDDIPVA